MVVVRPVRGEDLGALVELAESSGFGLTNLPRDPGVLGDRISRSLQAFGRESGEPGGELYLFVMEDLERKKLVGTSGIIARVGAGEPFYTFRIETDVFRSEVLNVRREIPCFHLSTERNGPSEIGALYVAPDYRTRGRGRLMSLSRFLFMAEHPGRFHATVLAEMRGLIDEHGRCAFWEAVGRHFYGMDFPTADYLTLKDKRFIGELMPRHPIYIPLLVPEGQAAIGRVHEHTVPALRLLEGEGFQRTDRIDAFDGGPVVTCPLRDVRTVRESRRAVVEAVSDGEAGSEPLLVGTCAVDFRACLGRAAPGPGGGVVLERQAADACGVREGDLVRYAPLRARGEPHAS